METPTLTLCPSERFNCLIGRLFDDVATRATNPWVPVEPVQLVLIKLIWRRLRRMTRRFAAILARFHAGAVAQAAVARPAGSSHGVRRKGPSQRFGWVIHAVSWFVWNRHYELEEMLEDPAMVAQVAEAPELGRVLRPLCRMLAVKPPAWLKLPQRARRRVVKTIPPAPDWILNEPHTVLRPDGSVWMHLGSSTHWKPGGDLTLEQARKFDPPIRIWPRPE